MCFFFPNDEFIISDNFGIKQFNFSNKGICAKVKENATSYA